MAKGKEKKETKLGTKKLDKQSEATPIAKKGIKHSSNPTDKHIAATPVFIALAVLTIGVCAFMAYNYVNNKDSEEPVSSEEVKLSRTEELELYTLPADADPEMINSDIMLKARAYYDEGEFDKALGLLGTVSEPSEAIVTSMNSLYARTYESIGNQDAAKEYYVLILNKFEKEMLKNAEQIPAERFSLAELYEKSGQIDNAIMHYEVLAEIEGTREELEAGEYDLYSIRESSIQALQRLDNDQ